ncbi:MAG: hypothetical protein IJ301_01200 [Clostridia bacterium]|nr:hypothetical protein [Clostridia bacterium]
MSKDYLRLEKDGVLYYKFYGKILDKNLNEVSQKKAKEISDILFKGIKFDKFSKERLKDLVVELKSLGQISRAIEACEVCFKRFGDDSKYIESILPVYRSCCQIEQKDG